MNMSFVEMECLEEWTAVAEFKENSPVLIALYEYGLYSVFKFKVKNAPRSKLSDLIR